MKRIFLVLSLLFVAYFASAQGNEELGISFDKSEHNFGQVVRENKKHACTFVLENKTDKPLVLLSVKTSCSCLKPQYSRRPLKVGEKSSIRMTLEAAKMEQGVFHRVVEVHTNAGVARVVVRGNVVLPND